MANLLQNTEGSDFGAYIPAAADEGMSLSQAVFDNTGELGKLNRAAERSQRLVDNINSRQLSVEEAYDRRIKAVKEATGVELENPERHRMTERERRQLRAQGVDERDISSYQRKIFDDRLAILQNAHPDKGEKLQFGDINEEAMAISNEAESEYEQARRSTKLGTAASLMASFGGQFQGALRDPIFAGSLFLGPTSAAGKSISARIFSSAWRQGAYNAGITALEQPAVQTWRREIGVQSGVVPGLVNVGEAFLFGAIPGAVFRGGYEGAKAAEAVRGMTRVFGHPAPIPEHLKEPLQRVLDGNPQTGDLEKAIEAANSALREIDADLFKPRSVAERAVRVGEEIDTADKAVRVPQPKNITPELHDSLTQTALRHAEDSAQPTPQAVAVVDAIEVWHGSSHDFEAFDLSKIGTGQGAQSYGHGAYLAENRAVAEQYKFEGGDTRINGRLYNPNDPLHRAVSMVDEFGSRDAALAEAKKLREKDIGDYWDDVVRNLESKKKLPALEGNQNVYKARIRANREHMLDWDKPLSEQSPYVKNALKRMYDKYGWEYEPGNRTVAELYQDAKKTARESGQDTGPSDLSNTLREAGIPGIKYLDQGSRNADAAGIKTLQARVDAARKVAENEPQNANAQRILADYEAELGNLQQPTRNFVIFDEKLIDITHKNDRTLHPVVQEVQDRITEAQPQSRAEAEQVASEALEDIGQRQTALRTREELAQTVLPEHPEKIVAAAVRTDQGVFRGTTHASAASEAEAKGVDISKLNVDEIDGFVTSTGRYVSREEAARIADAAEQRTVQEGRLESSTVDYQKGDYEVITREQAIALRPDMPANQLDAPYYKVGRAGTEAEGQLAGYYTLKEARKAAGLPEIEISKPSEDVLDKIPWADKDGNVKMRTASEIEELAAKDETLSMLVKSCQ